MTVAAIAPRVSPRVITPRKKENYVDNVKFYEELKKHRNACLRLKKGKEKPQIPEYLGECFLKIATHLSHKPNFVNYTFKDDMVSDGIENCLRYVLNFNPEKSKNPFGYFTQIVIYAFIRRIQGEKKHTYIKYRLIEKSIIDGDVTTPSGGITPDAEMLNFENVQEFIGKYDEYSTKRRARRQGRVPRRKQRKHRVELS